tara:strand:+ start:72 stop:2654 length:2583 start_codon:yes stop_codon:yes gene_type:complete
MQRVFLIYNIFNESFLVRIVVPFLISFFCISAYSQNNGMLNTVSDSNNKGGYFDGSGLSTYWYTGGGDGTITADDSDFFFDTVGSTEAKSLKVVVDGDDDYANNNVRVMTKNSNSNYLFDVSTSDTWNVSFYIKGEIGDELDFNIVKSGAEGTSISSASYKIRYKGWHYMRLQLSTPTASHTNLGRLRINFKSAGTYRLDNVVLEKGTFNSWYVGDGTNGSSTSNGSGTKESPFQNIDNAIQLNYNWSPGDLVYVRAGTYKNDNWDGTNDTWPDNPSTTNAGSDNNDPYLKIDRYTNYDSSGNGSANNGSKILADKNGSVDRPIVIRNYVDDSGTHETPKILFDGKAGFQFGSGTEGSNAGDDNLDWIITFLELAGFEIQGANQEITYAEASSNRTNAINLRTASSSNTSATRNMYHGRGIVVWGGYYVNIHNNTVYDCPNSGIRFNNSDYVRVSYNTVYNTTWWSYNGESGIVVAQSRNRDSDTSSTKIKMRITNNITYANINKIVYFNPSYDCQTGGSYDPNKDDYACGGRNKIVDGSGCYITRNSYDSDDSGGSNPNYSPHGSYYGTFLFANNVSYGNGMNGVVVHKTDYANVYNNTVYKNGEVPSSNDSDWVSAGNHTYESSEGSSSDWKTPLSSGRQNYTGIVVHSSSNVNVYNNISFAKNSNDHAYVNFVESDWSVSNVNFGSNKNIAGTGTNVAGGNQSLSASDFISSNGQFINADDNNLSNRDYKLSSSWSDVIDAADASYAPENDVSGINRPQGNSDDIGAYELSNHWDGSESQAWTTAGNWGLNVVPTADKSPVVDNIGNSPLISTNVNIRDLTIKSGATLTIDTNGTLTVHGTLTNSGSIAINGTVTVD